MTTRSLTVDDLPLLSTTDPRWAEAVLREPLRLLNDHAHLEKKAAGNALEMLNRWPEPIAPEHWVQTMTAVARDEIEHLAVVTRLLSRRGGRLTRTHSNPYAAGLRKLVRLGQGPRELMDRLMICALIEARSCERFAVLADHCEDKELAKLYRGLWASEAGHYLVFIELARALPETTGGDVEARWQAMLEAEAALLAEQPAYPGMHSGLP